jgi:hypothetical protein
MNRRFDLSLRRTPSCLLWGCTNVVIILLLTSITKVSCAHADEHKQLKRQVLSDCAAAQMSYDLLSADSRKELIPYLGRVLDLHLNSLQQAPMTEPNHPGSLLLSDPRIGDTPLLSNPSDEISAKRCALQLLDRLKPDSFSALPEILGLIKKPTIPSSLRNEATTLTRSLAHAFAQQKSAPSAEEKKIIEDLASLIDSENAFIAQAALIELADKALPVLIERLRLSNGKESLGLAYILESINSLGISVAPLIYPLLANSDEAIRISIMHLLGALKPPLPEVLPALIKILDDISPQVRQQSRLTIQKIVLTDKSSHFSLESTIQDSLVTSYRIAPLSERAEMQTWIPQLLMRIDGLLPRFLALSQGAPRDLKRDLIDCLASVTPLTEQAYKIVIQALNDPDISVRVMAIRALGACSNQGESAAKALNLVFKTLPPVKDLTERTPVLEAALAASTSLAPQGAAILVPHLIKSLEAAISPEIESDYRMFPHDREADSIRSRYHEHPAVAALVAMGEASRSSLEVVAKKGDSDFARRAITALGLLPYKESSVVVLARLLGSTHQATVNETARALLRIGAAVIPQLRKTSSTLALKARLHISELMIILGEKTLSDTKDLYKSLDHADCEIRIHRIILIADFTPSERAKLISPTIACFGQNHEQDHQTLTALIQLAPLEKNEQEMLLTMARSPTSSTQLQLALLDNTRALSIAPDLVLPIFEKLIQTAQGPLQIRAIRSLGKFGQANETLIETLKSMLSDATSEKMRSFAIVATLAKLEVTSFDFQDWVNNALDAESYEQVKKVLRAFTPAQAEQVILNILSDKSELKRLLALRLASEIFSPTKSLPERIEKLLSSTDMELKLAAFRVAIICCPLNQIITNTLQELI